MRIYKFVLVVLLTLPSLACAPKYSSVPTVTKFDISEQNKLQAAKHWELIAKNISKNLKADIQAKVSKSEKIYVNSVQKSAFTRSVTLEVIASLTKEGYRVIKPRNPENVNSETYAVKIDIETEVLEFSKGRKQADNIGLPSLITSGLWVLDALDATPARGVTLAAYGFDTYNWFNQKKLGGDAPKTEIIVDLVTSKNDEYISITKDIYYVSDTDKRLYEAAEDVFMKKYKIVGEK